MTPDRVLRAFADVCPASRRADADDAVAGMVPRYVVSPATVAEASDVLRAAAGHDLAVVARGGGTKLDWGAPPARCDLVVDTRRLDQVVEHAAGDLIARVQAGVTLDRLAETLASAGQYLALDPAPGTRTTDGRAGERAGATPGARASATSGARAGATSGEWGGATVGGTVATGAAGPRRLRYGTPRDLVIGLTVVRADGTVAKSGGKVVKNVAGYDLGKLFSGSFGTLGLIVEAVFRLHPRPAGSAYVSCECADAGTAQRAVAEVAGSQLAPSAVEVSRRARGGPLRVAVLLEGDADGVKDRAQLVRGLLGAAPAATAAPDWWGWEGTADTLLRMAFWPAAFPAVLGAADAAAARSGLDPVIGGSPAAGVLYAGLPSTADPVAVAGFVLDLRAAFAAGLDGGGPTGEDAAGLPPTRASAVVVRAAETVRDRLDLWGPVMSLGLMRAVKSQFDPGQRMSPGRFAGGI